MIVDLGKVGISVSKEDWSIAEPYERMTLVRHHGQGYLSLVDTITIEPGTDESVWMLIAVKGDKGNAFTYADFTPEQIAVLMQPAIDAAKRADSATETALSAAELANTAAGKADASSAAADKALEIANNLIKEVAKTAETANTLIEQLRLFGEEATKAENKRIEAETDRDSKETERARAEEKRQTGERGRNTAEGSRAQNEKKRISNETTRDQNEKARQDKEVLRDDAETKRDTAEKQRSEAETKRESDTQAAIDNANKVVKQITDFDVENSGKVAAAAINEIAADIKSLQAILTSLIKGELLCDKIMTRSLSMNGAEAVLVKESTPIDSPEFAGQFYVDKVGRKAYVAVGNSSVSDWISIIK